MHLKWIYRRGNTFLLPWSEKSQLNNKWCLNQSRLQNSVTVPTLRNQDICFYHLNGFGFVFCFSGELLLTSDS